MKKTLLLLGSTMLYAGAMQAYSPKTVSDCLVSVTSPNGMIGVSDDDLGTVVIVDYATGKTYRYEPEMETMADGNLLVTKYYSKGSGNCASNNGVVLVTPHAGNLYWENGEWKEVATNGSTMAQLNGVSADGNRICGDMGDDLLQEDGNLALMSSPFIWMRDANGEFSEYKALPVPEYDFSGRVPQRITAVAISGDGKMVAGQIWDYYGGVREPIVYREDADGNWSYELIEPEFYGLEWPEWPGEPPVQPDPTDYMSDDEREVYEEALENYFNPGMEPDPQQYMTPEEWQQYLDAYDAWDVTETPFPPKPTEFMTPEELAAYQKAVDDYWAHYQPYPNPEDYITDPDMLQAYYAAVIAYNEKFFEWDDKAFIFMQEYFYYADQLPKFDPNNVFLSGNGRYYASTSIRDYIAVPYRYDLQEGSVKSYDEDILLTYVNSDGVLMGGAPMLAYTRTAMLLENGDADSFIKVSEYIKEKNPELGTWVTQHCSVVGTPSGAQDLSVIWGWTNNSQYSTNILPVGPIDSGKQEIAIGKSGFYLSGDGELTVIGDVNEIIIYDLQGRELLKASNPGKTLSTGLGSGMYLVKGITASGDSIIQKVRI